MWCMLTCYQATPEDKQVLLSPDFNVAGTAEAVTDDGTHFREWPAGKGEGRRGGILQGAYVDQVVVCHVSCRLCQM